MCVRGAAARLGCDGGGRKLSVFFVGGTVCRARVAAVGSCRAGGERVKNLHAYFINIRDLLYCTVIIFSTVI